MSYETQIRFVSFTLTVTHHEVESGFKSICVSKPRASALPFPQTSHKHGRPTFRRTQLPQRPSVSLWQPLQLSSSHWTLLKSWPASQQWGFFPLKALPNLYTPYLEKQYNRAQSLKWVPEPGSLSSNPNSTPFTSHVTLSKVFTFSVLQCPHLK